LEKDQDCVLVSFSLLIVLGLPSLSGLRFGMLQSKVGLTVLLKNFKIKLSKRTKLPLQLDKAAFVTSAEGGIWLDVEKLE
jgi:hypothetical protein